MIGTKKREEEEQEKSKKRSKSSEGEKIRREKNTSHRVPQPLLVSSRSGSAINLIPIWLKLSAPMGLSTFRN